MDESDDSKIRRNLVVFSGVIILLTWLRVPVGELAGGLFKLEKGTQISQISQFRLWIACLVILLYLSLRYRFTKEWTKIGNAYRAEVLEKKQQLIDKRAIKSVDHFRKTKHRDGGFKGQLFTSYSSAVDEKKQKYADLIGEPEILIHRLRGDPVINGERVSMIFRWDAKRVRGIPDDGFQLSYKFDWLDQKWIAFYANAHTLAYSSSAVQYIIPILLTAVAFVVLLIRLIQSL